MKIHGASIINVQFGTVLAVTRPGKDDDWSLPGGKVEPGETAMEAAIRECEEEAGFRFTPEALVQQPFVRQDKYGKMAVAFFSPMLGEIVPRKREDQEKGIRCAWIPISKLIDTKNSYGVWNEKALKFFGIGPKTFHPGIAGP